MTYTQHDIQRQIGSKASQRKWSKKDWHAKVEDIIFEYEMLDTEIPFSGDTRPVVIVA